jgi:class 3 adenylate cyclase/TolB-like protein
MERRLSAILAADIVGYSAQMERDEAGTFARVTDRRRAVFEPEIARHQGRIFKTMGDGILAEFGSVVQAVECAVAIQAALEERNAAVPEDQAIRARIGINLGEVIVEGEDRYGEGVNIAARLEGLADPGGICVSEKVAREVEKKLSFGFVPMGAQRVKNIAEPVVVYRVTRDPVPRLRLVVARVAPSRRWAWGVGVLLTLLAAVALAFWWPGLAPRRDGPPGLAVLPFRNLTGDPAQDYLGMGIAEGIITALSTSPLVQVAARSSSYAVAADATPQDIARAIGVDYVVEGSLRRQGDRFSISTQIIDGRNGRNLWADRLEATGTDLAALEHSIARKAYATIAGINGQVPAFEEGLSWERLGPELEEYDYHLRGAKEYLTFTDHGKEQAERVWKEGLARFPGSALLRLELAILYHTWAVDGPTQDRWHDIETAWRYIEEAEAIPDRSRLEQWLLHLARAQVLPLAKGDFEGSVREAEAAHAMVPHDPQVNITLARVMANAGHGARAVEWAEFGVASAAEVPPWYRNTLARAYWAAGRPADAVREFDALDDRCIPCHISTLVRVGRADEARELAAWDRARRPDWTLEDERLWPSGRFPEMVDHLMGPYLDDLRKAGLE